MNQHTQRILSRMLSLLEGYQQSEFDLRHLVDGLEANLNALEERLPETFHHKWYNHWGRLEEILALDLEHERRDKVLENIRALESLVKDTVSGASSS